MSKVVNEMPPKGKYAWNEWFNGKKHFLTQGEDFQGDIKKMASNVYQAAKRKGVAVVVRIRTPENGLYVQAILKPAKEKKSRSTTRKK